MAFEGDGPDEKAVGFAHAGFSKNVDGSDLDYSKGVLSALKVVDCGRSSEISAGLLERACQYLKRKGATKAFAGSCFPDAPFFLGLYGGSATPGVLENDTNFLQALTDGGFQSTDRIIVWQRSLQGFRPIGGREQISIRRKFQVNTVIDPAPQNWWENCIYGMARRERFSIFNKKDQIVCGNITFWDMKPMFLGNVRARGAYGLNVPPEFRRSGIATFLLWDALKRLMQDGIELVEAQTRESETAAGGVFEKNGFEKCYFGTLMSIDL